MTNSKPASDFRRPVNPTLRLAVTIIDDQVAPTIDADTIVKLATPLLIQAKQGGDWVLEVHWVGLTAMRSFNRLAQGHDEPTDVLSFPVHFATNRPHPVRSWPTDQPRLLGSLVICPAVAARQALAHGRSTTEEIRWLIDHGLHHLLGHNHDDSGRWLWPEPRRGHPMSTHPLTESIQQPVSAIMAKSPRKAMNRPVLNSFYEMNGLKFERNGRRSREA